MTRHDVVFHADNGGSFAPTWGQCEMWGEIRRIQPADSYGFQLRTYLPYGEAGTVSRVLDTVRTLIERHASLRTRFRLDPLGRDLAEQIIDADGRTSVEIVSHADPELLDSEFRTRMAAAWVIPFDQEDDLPTRFFIAVSGRVVRAIGIVISHVVLDGSGAEALLADFRAILAGQAPEPAALDPIAQAASEQSAESRARSARAAEQIRPAILAARANALTAPRRSPAVPRYHGAYLTSAAFESAHDYLGRRLGLFTSSAISLVAMSGAIGRLAGSDYAVFKVVSGNRWSRASRSYVGNRTQRLYVKVATDPADIIGEIREADRAIRAGARLAPYDPVPVQALIDETGADLSLYFNDLRTVEFDAGAAPGRQSRPSDAFLRGQPASQVMWYDPVPPYGTDALRLKVYVRLRYDEGRLALTMHADDRFIDPAEIPVLLHEAEERVAGLALAEHHRARGAGG